MRLADNKELQERITKYAKQLGMSSREIDGALNKHRHDLRTYVRTLGDRVAAANRHLETEHSKRWYEQESIKSQARHDEEKTNYHHGVVEKRKNQSLEMRLQSVLARARLYDSRAKSPSLGGNGGANSEAPLGPPGSFTGQPPTIDLEDSKRVIEKHLERMEAKVDGYLGLRPPVAWSEKEKRELLKSLEGMHSAQVAEAFSELGSQRTIEKWRLELDPSCSPSTGVAK